jgi:hypothetical protein
MAVHGESLKIVLPFCKSSSLVTSSSPYNWLKLRSFLPIILFRRSNYMFDDCCIKTGTYLVTLSISVPLSICSSLHVIWYWLSMTAISLSSTVWFLQSEQYAAGSLRRHAFNSSLKLAQQRLELWRYMYMVATYSMLSWHLKPWGRICGVRLRQMRTRIRTMRHTPTCIYTII